MPDQGDLGAWPRYHFGLRAYTVGITGAGPTLPHSHPCTGFSIEDDTNLTNPQQIGWWFNVNELASFSTSNFYLYPAAEIQTQQAWGGYYQFLHDAYTAHWMAYQIIPFFPFIYYLVDQWTKSVVLDGTGTDRHHGRIAPASPML
jgi:hypothetical protein